MNLFIVNFKNDSNILPFEPFYYEGIAAGKIALYDKTLKNLEELKDIRVWLETLTNRNPLHSDNNTVVFFIPRNMNAPFAKGDFEVCVSVYIHELIQKHLDNRFHYVCFFLDDVDVKVENNEAHIFLQVASTVFEMQKYREAKRLYPCDFACFERDETVLSDILLPGNEELTCAKRVESVRDDVFRDYYQSVLNPILANMSAPQSEEEQKAMYPDFIADCIHKIRNIVSYRIAFFGGVSINKTLAMLVLCDYLCKLATDEKKLPDGRDINKANHNVYFLEDFDKVCEDKKVVIATYKQRLKDWLRKNKPPQQTPFNGMDELTYDKDYKGFPEYQEFIGKMDAMHKNFAIRSGFKNLAEADVTDEVLTHLRKDMDEAEKMLEAFSDVVVQDAFSWWNEHQSYLSEGFDNNDLDDADAARNLNLQRLMNQYDTIRKPSYSEEFAMLQDVEIINHKIRDVGDKMKAYSPLVFLFSLLFALGSVGVCYFITQFSVFIKEHTWNIFVMYLGVLVLAFLLPYGIVKLIHIARVKKLLKMCEKRIKQFMVSYKKLADEFAENVKNAMNYYCFFSGQCERSTQKDRDEKKYKMYLWHRPKMEAILKNLRCFDSFIMSTRPEKENNVPPLEDFNDDAAHSEFYQMKIFY